jgi:hypothetical protein
MGLDYQLANPSCSPASGIMYVRSQGLGDRVRPAPSFR